MPEADQILDTLLDISKLEAHPGLSQCVQEVSKACSGEITRLEEVSWIGYDDDYTVEDFCGPLKAIFCCVQQSARLHLGDALYWREIVPVSLIARCDLEDDIEDFTSVPSAEFVIVETGPANPTSPNIPSPSRYLPRQAVSFVTVNPTNNRRELVSRPRLDVAEKIATSAAIIHYHRPFQWFFIGISIVGACFAVSYTDPSGIVTTNLFDIRHHLAKFVCVVRRLTCDLDSYALGQDRTVTLQPDSFYWSEEYPRFVVDLNCLKTNSLPIHPTTAETDTTPAIDRWVTIGRPIWVSQWSIGRGAATWQVRNEQTGVIGTLVSSWPTRIGVKTGQALVDALPSKHVPRQVQKPFASGPVGLAAADSASTMISTSFLRQTYIGIADMEEKVRIAVQKAEDTDELDDSGIEAEDTPTPADGYSLESGVFEFRANQRPSGRFLELQYTDRVLYRELVSLASRPLSQYDSTGQLIGTLESAVQGYRALESGKYLHCDLNAGNVLLTSGLATLPSFLLDFSAGRVVIPERRTPKYANGVEEQTWSITSQFMSLELLRSIEGKETHQEMPRRFYYDLESLLWLGIYAIYKHTMARPDVQPRPELVKEYKRMFGMLSHQSWQFKHYAMMQDCNALQSVLLELSKSAQEVSQLGELMHERSLLTALVNLLKAPYIITYGPLLQMLSKKAVAATASAHRHTVLPTRPPPPFLLAVQLLASRFSPRPRMHQRRPGKGVAHIAPPLSASPMGSLSEKSPSRLNQKTFGVTNRIWLILSLFLALIFFTRFVIPSEAPQHSRHRLLHADLKPKNYLNISNGDVVPFAFCPALGPGDELASKYDPIALAKTRMHVGSGARMQRVISRALAGHPVTISIVGGSVSACHGAGDDPLSPSCYPSLFFNWWNEVFPHPASELTNGAMRRTNSAYFSFCNGHHVPDVVDLVIIELDSADESDPFVLENFENLIRSLLIRPDQPAVLILGHFAPQIQNSAGFLGPDHWHTVVAQFYDVPHISVKPLLYSKYMSNPESILQQYYADPVLASPAGHQVISDVLVSYFQSLICAAWSAATGTESEALPGPGMLMAKGGADPAQPKDAKGLFPILKAGEAAPDAPAPEPNANPNVNPNRQLDVLAPNSQLLYPHLRVPLHRINAVPSKSPFREIAPFCVSASANDLVNPLPAALLTGSGWSAYHPAPGSAELTSHQHYWYSTLPTSRLRVPVFVGAGDIGIYYLREPMPENGSEGAAVECWVDDNYTGAVVIENYGNVGEDTPSLEIIDRGVAPGSHYVECQLMGEEDERGVPPFKIIGIFAT
ncbi:Cap64p [Steccherinum ochraceum]|uniref:Cap64p n=1 Tax=Steccherinum ochraceum TaxID=92696 RepID=A0A4R0RJZ6_9APHY|nr:Cap64p [Steccherinum ochraceum]